MSKTYIIDVVIKGQSPNTLPDEEPIIATTRVAVETPNHMTSRQKACAIGEEIQHVGAHMLDSAEQLGDSIQRYEEAMDERIDLLNILPDNRPN